MASDTAFTMDSLLQAMRRLEEAKPAGGFIRDMVLGDRAADYFKPVSPYSNTNLWGVPVKASSAFPIQHACVKCGGTGYGVERTFCDKCGGAGEICVEGMCKNDRQTILLTSPLPRKAYVKWPEAILVPLREI